jgi:lauroyl/myristoyl acyltransferase
MMLALRYCAFRFARLVWQHLPERVGYALASLVGDLTYILWYHGRTRVRENMASVLGPGASPRTVERLARESMRNYCKYLADFLRFPCMSREEIERRVVFDGWHNMDLALQGGKGIIFIGLHMGNWDLAAAAISRRQYPLNVIAESLQPARLNTFIQGMRAALGMRVIPVEKGASRFVRALRRNEILGLLIDRPSPSNGVAVRFFDRLTQVPSGAAALALKTGARVLTGGLVRRPDGTFLGVIHHQIPFEPAGDWQQDVSTLTQQIMSSLETLVRQYPDQWYMFRRMWVQGEGERPVLLAS